MTTPGAPFDWQPETGARYMANADGLILARAEHAEKLVKAGCARDESHLKLHIPLNGQSAKDSGK